MNRTKTIFAVLALVAASPAVPLLARPVPQAAALDARPVVEAVRKAIAANYVLPARRPALDAALAKGLADGRYAVTDPGELARRITDDLFAVAHDKHLGLNFDPRQSAALAGASGRDDAENNPVFDEFARTHNHGVSELKVLDGNVRYLRYDGFLWTGAQSEAAIDSAMAFLRGGDAIIIDLRTNGGGSPDAVRRIASYFVPAGVKLVTFHLRSDPPTVSTTDKDVPGGRIAGVPVYVLASGRSASAAEEFLSHAKLQKFGTLVGETSAGAGYRNELIGIPQGFVLSVSIGRPELPDGSDWEAKGVAPDIAASAPDALARAQIAALDTLAAKAQGPRRAELGWLADAQRARVAPAPLARPLAAYAGRYGPRTISVEDGKLVYRRDGGVTTALLPLGPDRFVMEADSGTQIRFTLTGGAVTGFELLNADGPPRVQAKDG
ncbi:S41 family peptidase [Sphingomonas sp.]|uniref:S41 family peptidase n=1 Tax=Sphingomonas sp. TaxID=28214 RepID=UPI001B17975D|nr:S41 family peptidase [Sphingomonas sp.]MBO9714105.1 hypothetical protein [Sphingomonas sp.]